MNTFHKNLRAIRKHCKDSEYKLAAVHATLTESWFEVETGPIITSNTLAKIPGDFAIMTNMDNLNPKISFEL